MPVSAQWPMPLSGTSSGCEVPHSGAITVPAAGGAALPCWGSASKWHSPSCRAVPRIPHRVLLLWVEGSSTLLPVLWNEWAKSQDGRGERMQGWILLCESQAQHFSYMCGSVNSRDSISWTLTASNQLHLCSLQEDLMAFWKWLVTLRWGSQQIVHIYPLFAMPHADFPQPCTMDIAHRTLSPQISEHCSDKGSFSRN